MQNIYFTFDGRFSFAPDPRYRAATAVASLTVMKVLILPIRTTGANFTHVPAQ